MNQFTLFAVAAFSSSSVLAQEMTVGMTDLCSGQSVGTVTLTDSEYGPVFTQQLTGLPPGLHGFHVHANGPCETPSKDGKTVL
ncbi:superoxide dismutase family protein, partial [Vibrio cholerae]|uniref:superoxide dismutase family protein n=1 Tax=Vibrio cholerae TaxID=666 RepID=UPI0018F0CD13